MCLIVIMPVYNEEKIIDSVLEQWIAKLDAVIPDKAYRIHVYNDGSRDNTAEAVDSVVSKYPGKVVLCNKANSGHGATVLEGYRANTDHAEWLFQVDSDNETTPDDFDKLWALRNDYDFIAGCRSNRKQPLSRKCVSLCSRLSVRLFYGKSISDVNTPYRLMHHQMLREMLKCIPPGTFAPNVIISGLAAKKNWRFCEVPIAYQERTTGEVSIKKLKLLKAAILSFFQVFCCALRLEKKNLIFALLAALTPAAATVFSGLNGIYFMDTSSMYFFGFLKLNGWIPHTEITSPLGPLSGEYMRLAYSLFGINYLAPVWLNAIVSAISAICFYRILKRHCTQLCALGCSIMLTTVPLPFFGTYFYNEMIALLFAWWFVLAADWCFKLKMQKTPGALYCIAVLSGLTKYHMGVILIFLTFLLDLSFLFQAGSIEKKEKKHIICKKTGAMLLFAAVLAAITLLECHFDFCKLLSDMFTPSVRNRLAFNFRINLLCIITGILCLSGGIVFIRQKNVLQHRSIFYSLAILFCSTLYLLTADYTMSGKQTVWQIFIIGNLMLACIVCGKYRLPRIGGMIFSASFVVFLFHCVTAFYSPTVKNWNEMTGAWYRGTVTFKENKDQSDAAFFKGVYMRFHQKKAIDFICETDRTFKDKKIFFGPEIEMFYPVTGRFPPKGWLLWSHLNYSFRGKDIPRLKKILMHEKYDIIVLSCKRGGLSPFFDRDELGFKYCVDTQPYTFLLVFCKDEEMYRQITEIKHRILKP